MKQLAAGLIILALGTVPAAAEAWHPYTRTPNVVFMADVDSITVTGEITSVRVASAERTGDAGDYSHSVETFEFRCGTPSTWRTAGVVEYGPDGTESGRYPEEAAAWEVIHPNTSPEYLERIACDGARAQPPIWATIKDYIDAGRG